MFMLMFAPESWLKVRLFRLFLGQPFPDHPELRKGAKSVENHIQRFQHLANLTNRLRTALSDDEAELRASGYTPAQRSHEYAALIETLFCELYGCLDGLRRSIFGAYSKVRGVQNKSNKTLFDRASDSQYGEGFPEAIRTALAKANDDWFPELRRIRTEVTHGEVGFCHLDRETDKVTYMHPSLGTGEQALVIEDVTGKVNGLARNVILLTEVVYGFWYEQLLPIERRTVCGIWNGRFFERQVGPEPSLSMNSGRCYSAWWFRNDRESRCPLADSCEAYARREEQVRQLAYTIWTERGRPTGDDLADWYRAEETLSLAYLPAAPKQGDGS